MKNYLMVDVFVVAAILLTCSCETGKNITESESGNRCVKGKIFLSDGITPAPEVQVAVRLKTPTASIFSNDQNGKSQEISGTTGADGSFEIECRPDNGVYVVEASGKNESVLIDSIIIDDGREDIVVPPGTMKPGGAVRGNIATLAAVDSADVYVLAWGMNRFAAVENDGSFIFGNLPEGDYILRFMTSAAAYGSWDIAGVKIRSNDTTDIGAVNLPLAVLPVPVNMCATYDTLHLTVTLTWEKPDNADELRYAVYRKIAGASSAYDFEISAEFLDSNMYVDSFLMKSGSIIGYAVSNMDIDSFVAVHGLYEYRVVTVGIDGKKSLKSNPAKVNVFPYLKYDSILVVPYLSVKEDTSNLKRTILL